MLKQHINIAVDVILFTIIDDKAHVLLIKRKHEPFEKKLAFPGGFVQDFEKLNDAALRELKEETGIDNINLEILDVYDDLERDPRARVISVAFIGVVDFERINHLRASDDALVAQWVSINEVKELAFDHNKMFLDALKFLSAVE